MKLEIIRRLVKHRNASDIAGKNVWSELNSVPRSANGFRQRPRKSRLAESGNVLDEQVLL
jgi:hypothetical protein